MAKTQATTNLSVKNGNDEDRHGILNQKSERGVNCLAVSDIPLFGTVIRKSASRISNNGTDEIRKCRNIYM